MSEDALEIYLEKLAYFEADLARTSDTGLRFSIEQWIQETKAKIVELGGEVPVTTRPAMAAELSTRPIEDTAGAGEEFDVLLSYNRTEQAEAEELGGLLEDRGLRVWADFWEIPPGRLGQRELEEIIKTTRSAAVLVGRDGLGPWNDRSMRACLKQFHSRDLPVIPVLMPGVPTKPDLPPFLGLMTWADLRGGLKEEALDRLQWGITGVRPGAGQPGASRQAVRRRVAGSAVEKPAGECRILFLASNPTTEVLALQEEVREIETKIRAARHRDTLRLISKWAVRPDDLLQELDQHRPHVVHFSGHGVPGEGIILQDAKGRPKPVSTRALAALFTTLKDNIRLVFLNACHSKPQARAIIQVVDCAVAMREEVSDEASIIFASSFYRAIGFGRSVQDAFDQGNTALMLEDYPEEETAELLERDGVKASDVLLVRPS